MIYTRAQLKRHMARALLSARLDAGLARSALSAATGIGHDVIEGIERGATTPHLPEIVAIATATGTDLSTFLIGLSPITEPRPSGAAALAASP